MSESHLHLSFENGNIKLWNLLLLACACLTLIACLHLRNSFAASEADQPSRMDSPAPEAITKFPSPYMNARDTELATMDNGAVVGADTKAYWDLHPDAPERASYDEDVIVEVADGVWTIGTAGLVNSHVVRGPEGLIVYDTGENDAEGAHFYKMLRTVSDLPIRAIIYSHEHYVNGTRVMIEAEAERGNTDIKIIGHPLTNEEMAKTGGMSSIHPEVGGVLWARAVEQFNFYLPTEGPDAAFKNTVIPGAGGFVPVNTPVEHGQKMTIAVWAQVFNNLADPSALLDEGKIEVVNGNAAKAKALFSLFDPIYDWENDEALKQLAKKLELAPN